MIYKINNYLSHPKKNEVITNLKQISQFRIQIRKIPKRIPPECVEVWDCNLLRSSYHPYSLRRFRYREDFFIDYRYKPNCPVD